MIVTIESTPDTVIALATGSKVVVAETPEEVSQAVRAWRVGVLSAALRTRGEPLKTPRGASRKDSTRLSAVEDEPA
jgi:uncharacterized protein YlzI (FlbEa/FlbD family)